MKKNNKTVNNILLLVLIILLIILFILFGLLFMKMRKENGKNEEQATEEIVEETTEIETETEQMEEEVSLKDTAFIFVGESHMVVADAEYASNGSDIGDIEYGKNLFFVQTGLNGWMGTAEWLLSDQTNEGEEGAILQIDQIIKEHSFKKGYLFLQHGSSMSQYKDYWPMYEEIYQKLQNRYPQFDLFVISVPPVQEKLFLEQTGVVRSNKSIQEFNQYTQSLLNENQYLDYYQWFEEEGVYQDYIHFQGKTYKSLFNKIMGNVME